MNKFKCLIALLITNMSSPPIILFDFDGVIISQKALEYTASIFRKKEFYRWVCIDNLRLIDFARLFEEADSKNRIKAFMKIIKIYKNYIPSTWRRILFFLKFRRFFPKYEKYETLKTNLEDILRQLKSVGFHLGIVSNTSGKRLSSFRKRLNLDNYFSVFISRDDTSDRKPSPYPIYDALITLKKKKKISIDRNEVYYVGDLPHDIKCAKNAGVKSIALLSGHGTREDLENSNPTYLIADIKDLIEIKEFKKYLLN